ncbi:MAG: hypothetical protein F6K56_27860 [Moorea sp. SIO3G5]|nr:hypothetical protein [Moorena sp. SIO3G5]
MSKSFIVTNWLNTDNSLDSLYQVRLNTHNKSVGTGRGEMGRWGDGEMGRWGDGEMGKIFIKGNYPDMILDTNQLCPLFRQAR